MKNLTFIVIFSLVGFNTLKAMPHRENRTNKSTLDSLHKIWKFKTVELIEDPSGAMRTVNIENYELWD